MARLNPKTTVKPMRPPLWVTPWNPIEHRSGSREVIPSLPVGCESGTSKSHAYLNQMVQMVNMLPAPALLSTQAGHLLAVNQPAKDLMADLDWRLPWSNHQTLWRALKWPSVPFYDWNWKGTRLSVWDCPLGPFPSAPHLVLRNFKQEGSPRLESNGLLERQALLGENVGRIVHDIRNPLASLEWLATLMGGKNRNAQERKELAGHLVKAVRGLNGLVSNLLVFSKPISVARRRLRISALFDEVEWLAVQPLRQKRITIRRYVEPGAEILWGDESLLQQTLLNLLLNAVHASESGGSVEMVCHRVRHGTRLRKTAEKSAQAQISIKDTGYGIAPDDMGKIFDPFFSKRKGGTGLGLSIVKQIVDAHHGLINVQSERGKGTTVTLTLP